MIARLVPAAAVLALVALATPPSIAAPAKSGAAIVTHPNSLVYPPLTYAAPVRSEYRHELSNGVVVYVVPDSGLPLVDVYVTVRGGDYMDPAGKTGLSAITADQIRSGGAGSLTADQFDEEVDFLALQMGTGSGMRESIASFNALSKDLDRALELLFLAMREPRFQDDRVELYRNKVQQILARRNDNTTSIEQREWKRLIYGATHFESQQVTDASLGSITREDMVAFHRRVWHPGNMVIGVSGDVKPADVVAKLEKQFAGWEKGEPAPPAPLPDHQPPKGIFVVGKPDVNQTRVSIGHLGTTWKDPRRASIEIMNEILGGGGFTSRITRKVRSDEGLAYSAGSSVGFGREYPLSFRMSFQSKNQSVSRAAAIALAEMERIRKEPVSDEELTTAKNSLIESFPQRFGSAQAKASIFVNDEILGRPADYWEKYRPEIKAVTKEGVQTVAFEFLHPDNVTMLVVGKTDEVVAGDKDFPDYTLQKLAGDTPILEVPLPDPASLRYPHEPRAIIAPVTPPTPAAGDQG